MDIDEIVALLSTNCPDAVEAIKSLPSKTKQANLPQIISLGLIPAIHTNFANGQFFLVRDVCFDLKEAVPPRFFRQNAFLLSELSDALLQLKPAGEALAMMGLTPDEVVGYTASGVAPLLVLACKDLTAAEAIVPKYMLLLDRNLNDTSLWNNVWEMSTHAPKAMSTHNDVLCRAITEKVLMWTIAATALGNTASYNIDPIVDVVEDLVDLCDSSGTNTASLHGVLTALADRKPDCLGKFLDVFHDQVDDGMSGPIVMPLLAKMSSCEALKEEMKDVLNWIEEDVNLFGSSSYVFASAEIVAKVAKVSWNWSDEKDVKRIIKLLLCLAEVQKSSHGPMSSMPLLKLREVYERDSIPRSMIDEFRDEIEWYRGESPDQAARDASRAILNYRDERDVDALHGRVEDVSMKVDQQGQVVGDVRKEVDVAMEVVAEARAGVEEVKADVTEAKSDAAHAAKVADEANEKVDAVVTDVDAVKEDAAEAKELATAAAEKAELAEAELKEVREYVDERMEEMQEFIGEMVKKLPVPVLFSSVYTSMGTQKNLTLYFECSEKGSGCLFPGVAPTSAFVSETTAVNKWLKVAVAAVQVGVAVMESDPFGGVSSIQEAWAAANQSYDGAFKSFVSEPFLTSMEQDSLIEQLRDNNFFDQFEYWAQKGCWRCCRCHQKERRQASVRQNQIAQVVGSESSNSRDGVLLESSLEKRSGGFLKSWKKRHFKVYFDDGTRQIQYHDLADSNKRHGCIELSDVMTIKKVGKEQFKKDNCFSVFTTKRKWYFAAKDEREANNWIAVLNNCVDEING